MYKNSSAKHYQDNKEKLQNMLLKDIKVFLKKKRKESGNIVVKERCKNLPEDEKQKLVDYRRKYKMHKTPYYNYKKLFSLRKSEWARRDARASIKNLLW